MSRAALAVALALSVLTLSVIAGEAVMLAVHRAAARGWLVRRGPRTRAGLLAQARMASLSLAAVFVPLVLAAFWRFEPADAAETTGFVLPGLAAIGSGLVAVITRRAWRTLRATRALGRAWRSAGERASIAGWPGRAWIVTTPFPVVAVVGWWRPELFVARAVVAGCTPSEIAVIAAHERAHVARHDNLTRMAFALTPDLSGAGERLERAWSEAAETLADLSARRTGDGVALAQALTRVARMATGPAPAWPVSALIDAGAIDTRVRRLLLPAEDAGRPADGLPTLALVPAAVLTVLLALPVVYEAAEWLVGLGR
ncbi:MAG: hypothetical protein R2708_22430 [Vicinamibacterales bacterium]